MCEELNNMDSNTVDIVNDTPEVPNTVVREVEDEEDLETPKKAKFSLSYLWLRLMMATARFRGKHPFLFSYLLRYALLIIIPILIALVARLCGITL